MKQFTDAVLKLKNVLYDRSLGDKSRLMSMRGVPLTRSNSSMSVVNSSFESASFSNIVGWVDDRKNSVKLE